MKVSTEPLESRQIRLTIEVGEDRAEKVRRRVARQISRDADIPGFRRGKAPYGAIVQRYGEEVVNQELASLLGEEVYAEALEEEGIAAFAPGTLEETESDPLRFTFTVPLPPKVELGDYRSYRLEQPRIEVTEGQVHEALEAIREDNAVLAPVDRPAALGDAVVVDLVGRTIEGETFVDQAEAEIVLDEDSGVAVPGLIEAIVGMEEGDVQTSTFVLPEDFPDERFAGQEVDLTIELNEVYDRILPELDDDLARTVGNFESFEELRQRVERQLVESARSQAEREYPEKVLENLMSQAVIEYPPALLEDALDDAVEDYERAVKRREHMMLNDFLRIQGRTMEELRDDLKPGVEDSLRRSLLLGEVVKREELEVSDEEIEAQIEQSSAQWDEREDEVRAALNREEGRQEMRSRILARKATELLVAIARGEAPEPTPDEEAGESERSEASS